MKKNYGNQRRHFSETEPKVYDKETRTVCIDIQEDTQVRNDSTTSEEGEVVNGYSYFEHQIDGNIDYGHIKSQLVESAYPQKDEHAFAINAISALLKERDGETLSEDETDAIAEFKVFNEWRTMCAAVAKEIVGSY